MSVILEMNYKQPLQQNCAIKQKYNQVSAIDALVNAKPLQNKSNQSFMQTSFIINRTSRSCQFTFQVNWSFHYLRSTITTTKLILL
jgi:hypothetical protein